MAGSDGPGDWVLLTYRLPRTPSAPRLAVWRKLRRLGVAQLSDGLVALPADARTREQLEWLADDVLEAGGAAGVWLARPATTEHEQSVAATMQAARVAEYEILRAEAQAALDQSPADRSRAWRRIRAQLRRVQRRDFFPPSERIAARAAVQSLADSLAPALGQRVDGEAIEAGS